MQDDACYTRTAGGGGLEDVMGDIHEGENAMGRIHGEGRLGRASGSLSVEISANREEDHDPMRSEDGHENEAAATTKRAAANHRATPAPEAHGDEKRRGTLACFYNFLEKWPRTVAILHRQLLVYSLIAVTLLGGYAISKIEGPAEVENNDHYLRQAWFLRSLPIQRVTSALVGLPTTCLIQYASKVQEETGVDYVGGSNNNTTTAAAAGDGARTSRTFGYKQSHPLLFFDWDFFSSPGDKNAPPPNLWVDANITVRDLYGIANTTFPDRKQQLLLPPITPPKMPPVPPISNENGSVGIGGSDGGTYGSNLYDYMLACEELASELLRTVVDFTLEVATQDLGLLSGPGGGGGDGLTFDWIRCWNETEIGWDSDPFMPNKEQIDASDYVNQSLYFASEWNAHRTELYNAYVSELGCYSYDDGVDEVLSSSNHSKRDFYEGDDDFDDDSNNNDDDIDVVRERALCYWEATKRSVLEATGGNGCQTNTGSSAWFWFTVMTSEFWFLRLHLCLYEILWLTSPRLVYPRKSTMEATDAITFSSNNRSYFPLPLVCFLIHCAQLLDTVSIASSVPNITDRYSLHPKFSFCLVSHYILLYVLFGNTRNSVTNNELMPPRRQLCSEHQRGEVVGMVFWMVELYCIWGHHGTRGLYVYNHRR